MDAIEATKNQQKFSHLLREKSLIKQAINNMLSQARENEEDNATKIAQLEDISNEIDLEELHREISRIFLDIGMNHKKTGYHLTDLNLDMSDNAFKKIANQYAKTQDNKLAIELIQNFVEQYLKIKSRPFDQLPGNYKDVEIWKHYKGKITDYKLHDEYNPSDKPDYQPNYEVTFYDPHFKMILKFSFGILDNKKDIGICAWYQLTKEFWDNEFSIAHNGTVNGGYARFVNYIKDSILEHFLSEHILGKDSEGNLYWTELQDNE